MTRMIERWFPSAGVSDNSSRGWGSGNAEISLFMWFAKRPTAQAKAAVVCSLLPWPDTESEQERLQSMVGKAMKGRYAEWSELQAEITKSHPHGASVLDPFVMRNMGVSRDVQTGAAAVRSRLAKSFGSPGLRSSGHVAKPTNIFRSSVEARPAVSRRPGLWLVGSLVAQRGQRVSAG
jgi:hypothetical protein